MRMIVRTSAVVAVWSATALTIQAETGGDDVPPALSRRTLLTVESSAWSASCQRFWKDFQSDAAFRGELLTRFQLQTVDVDRLPAADVLNRRCLPVFVTTQARIREYAGKAWLLDRLGSSRSRRDVRPAKRIARPEPLGGFPAEQSRHAGTVDPSAIPDASASSPAEPESSFTENKAADELSGSPGPLGQHSRHVLAVLDSAVPVTLSVLQILGLLGGTAATGGMGAILLRAGWGILRRRRRHRAEVVANVTDTMLSPQTEGSTDLRAPFPRRLDEARQLLALRASEGRVAVLDALRGMFLDDELQKLTESAGEREASLARRLKNAIDIRVDEVAPLSTTID